MRKLLSAAAAALFAASSLTAQTLTIAPDAGGAEIGPFGQDPALLTFTSIGQTFVPLNGFLQSFAFFLRDDAGTGSSLLYRASIADFTGGAIGPVLFTSGNIQGTSVMATGGVRVQYPTSGSPLDLALDPSRTYVAFLSVNATSGLFAAGTNALTQATGNASATGEAVGDFGGGLQPLSPVFGTDVDLAFEATFSASAISAVPEPATVLLVGGGLALVGVATRRRRAA